MNSNFTGHNVIKYPLSHLLENIGKLSPTKMPEELAKIDHPSLRIILRLAVDPSIKWLLPSGPTPLPPPKPHMVTDQGGPLYAEARRLYLFIEGGHATLKQVKRESLWIELLSYIHPDDAKLLDMVKDRKLPGKLSAAVVKKTFPDLF